MAECQRFRQPDGGGCGHRPGHPAPPAAGWGTGQRQERLDAGALLTLARRLRASDLDIIIIDPKGIDFAPFCPLPHVRGGRVVAGPEEAIGVLRQLISTELAERTRLLQEWLCSNLRDLRARHPEVPAKYTVVAIDEYAELVSILARPEREEFERQILRLAQRARAVGIHLVIG